MITGKFTVTQISQPYPKAPRTVTLDAVYDGSPEDTAFHDASPSGSIEMCVTRASVADEFQIGDRFYVRFEKIPPAGDSTGAN